LAIDAGGSEPNDIEGCKKVSNLSWGRKVPVLAFVTNKKGAFPTRGLSFCPSDGACQKKPYGKRFRDKGVLLALL